MPDIRWNYLKGIGFEGNPDEIIKKMGLESYSEALNWAVDELKELRHAASVFGCGPCCNAGFGQFIKAIEEKTGTNINDLVVEHFDSMTDTHRTVPLTTGGIGTGIYP